MARYEITLADGYGRELDKLVVTAQNLRLALLVSEATLRGRSTGDSPRAVSASVELLGTYAAELPEPSERLTVPMILALPMEELELGVRAYNILKRHGIDTCGQVLTLTESDLEAWQEADPLHRLGGQAERQLREAQSLLRSMIRQAPEPEPGGSVTCTCGAVIAWEGEEPDECLRCGRNLVESRALFACSPDESAGQAELHSTRSELHPVAGVDLDAVARLEEFSQGLGEIDGGGD
jgi:hypothetical protein